MPRIEHDFLEHYVPNGWSYVLRHPLSQVGSLSGCGRMGVGPEGPGADSLAVVLRLLGDQASTLRTITDRLGQFDALPPSAEYLSIKRAATFTGLSQSHLRRAIRKGELPASNQGSQTRPIWRIARRDLVSWMEAKCGGTPIVPPKPELKGLIDRYFP